jgi:hypothetical protein
LDLFDLLNASRRSGPVTSTDVPKSGLRLVCSEYGDHFHFAASGLWISSCRRGAILPVSNQSWPPSEDKAAFGCVGYIGFVTQSAVSEGTTKIGHHLRRINPNRHYPLRGSNNASCLGSFSFCSGSDTRCSGTSFSRLQGRQLSNQRIASSFAAKFLHELNHR